MAQRYSKELEGELPEVDLFVGTGQYHQIKVAISIDIGHSWGIGPDSVRCVAHDWLESPVSIAQQNSHLMALIIGRASAAAAIGHHEIRVGIPHDNEVEPCHGGNPTGRRGRPSPDQAKSPAAKTTSPSTMVSAV